MTTQIERKKELRKEMLFKRTQVNGLEKDRIDEWVCKTLWELICEKEYRNIHCYLPMGTEINTTPLIEKMLLNKLTVVAPKTLPKCQLEHLVLSSMTDLEKGVFGTRHPSNSYEFKGEYDLIIVPGLAFNESNQRLGYGGGYYDTFLAKHPNAFKLGICYSFQNIIDLPLEDHDVELDGVLFA